MSYFVALNAEYGKSASVLAGDRNLTNDTTTTHANVAANQLFRWTDAMHQRKGNLLYADGHVERPRNTTEQFADAGSGPEVLVLPRRVAMSRRPDRFRPRRHPLRLLRQLRGARRIANARRRFSSGRKLASFKFPLRYGRPQMRFRNPLLRRLLRQSPLREDELMAASFDQRLVRTLQKIVTRGYLLLLLLLLLLLAYLARREWKKWQQRQIKNQPLPNEL